jgi:hypothetical protein
MECIKLSVITTRGRVPCFRAPPYWPCVLALAMETCVPSLS